MLDTAPTCSTTYTDGFSVSGSPYSTSCSGGVDGNYSFGYTGGTVSVNKADAIIVVAPYTVTYDGNEHTATITSITGVNGETGATVGTVDVSNTAHTNAGTYNTDSWSFTGTANYNDIVATTITDTIYDLVDLDPTLLTAYNLVGTSHTLDVTVDPANAGTPVLFTITGVNPQTGTVLTNSSGVASYTYSDTLGGIDTITACIDLNTDQVCDSELAKVVQTKYWLTKFLTGGGNVRTGKGNNSLMWTFGGNVGLAGNNTPVGQFQVRDHNGFGYHFNNVLSVALTGLQTFTFTASGWTQGSTKTPVTATITVVDGDTNGKNKSDTIGVTITDPAPGSTVIPALTGLTGGNLKVFVQ